MQEQRARGLGDVRLVALCVDGVQITQRRLVVALRLAEGGRKLPLDLWQGSTDNAAVRTEMLQDPLRRGLVIEGRLSCVTDGNALRKSLLDVLGAAAYASISSSA